MRMTNDTRISVFSLKWRPFEAKEMRRPCASEYSSLDIGRSATLY